MKKKILVSGGTGFIGFHISQKLIESNYLVSILSSKKPSKIRYLKKAKYIKCDVTKKKNIQKKLINNYDYVINLAGYVNHLEKKKTLSSHFNGCKNLADHFVKKKIKRFIQISSGAEYGKEKSPQNENIKCKPKSNYGRAKFLATKYLLSLGKKKKFPFTILRLYQVYGPKQDYNRFIPIAIRNSLDNKKFNTSSGEQKRDFLYIDDVVDAVRKCLINKKSKGQIFNLGCGKPIKLKTVLSVIKKICKGGQPTFGKIQLRKEENLITYPNIYKIKKILRWKPKYSFYSGLKKTIKFYEKN